MIWLNRYTDAVYCVIRVVVGLMFACHGGQKILGFPPGERGGPTIASLAGWIELAGGLLIAFGLLTRIAAFISSGEMAVAYFMVSFTGKPSVMRRLRRSDFSRSSTKASCRCCFVLCFCW